MLVSQSGNSVIIPFIYLFCIYYNLFLFVLLFLLIFMNLILYIVLYLYSFKFLTGVHVWVNGVWVNIVFFPFMITQKSILIGYRIYRNMDDDTALNGIKDPLNIRLILWQDNLNLSGVEWEMTRYSRANCSYPTNQSQTYKTALLLLNESRQWTISCTKKSLLNPLNICLDKSVHVLKIINGRNFGAVHRLKNSSL